ncbi:MptD family putative ECF transporter S component [Corynebacterium macginleyi]|uniref:MptD family putative ECF transporter S component n=1 Tax=Corynebacterium macginleyi TaxID=38290 RepID=UPI00190C6B77|nr:MptD family putative ECF transporter S component [Corynebacterium macginleyi]MBK4166581.1 MptD family putative ECF transporter S component [Corynebacterium macginleyi]
MPQKSSTPQPTQNGSSPHGPTARLNTRDLINAGIFAALYFVITFVTGMIGFAGPQFMFIGWFIAVIANAIVLALYAARTPKMGAFTIVCGINGLVFMLTGHYYWTFLGGIILGFIADLIITKSRLGITKSFPIAYGVFCTWVALPFVPLILDTESYYADIANQMGKEYADAMSNIFQPWTVGVLAIGALIVGFIGGKVGIRVSRRHFEGAGLL